MSGRNYKIIMGIETSCDDTAVAIVNSKKEILSNVVINQNTNSLVIADIENIFPDVPQENIEELINVFYNQPLII